jgi:hypothetical protein
MSHKNIFLSRHKGKSQKLNKFQILFNVIFKSHKTVSKVFLKNKKHMIFLTLSCICNCDTRKPFIDFIYKNLFNFI